MNELGISRHYKSKTVNVKLPYAADNRLFLVKTVGNRSRRKITWDAEGKFWTIPGSKLSAIRDAMIERYGETYLWREGKKSVTLTCHVKCRGAEGPDCECACAGRWHGYGLGYSENETIIGDVILVKEYREGYVWSLIHYTSTGKSVIAKDIEVSK